MSTSPLIDLRELSNSRFIGTIVVLRCQSGTGDHLHIRPHLYLSMEYMYDTAQAFVSIALPVASD